MPFLRAFIIPLIILLVLTDMVFFRYLLKVANGIGLSIYLIIIVLALEYYSFHAFRTINKTNLGFWIYISIHIVLYGSLLYFVLVDRNGLSANIKKLMIVLTLFIVPKIFISLALIFEDVVRVFQYTLSDSDTNKQIPGRRKVMVWIALGIASIPFIGVLDGIFFGKYRFRVIRKTVYFDDLPQEFDGFTITQLSDIHSGSFDDVDKVNYGIKMAADQNSDILVFTGDMVNNVYKELLPYKDILSQLSAPSGMFAVLGNHDYGDYGDLTEDEKKESIAKIQEIQREIGFQPLNNQMQSIERNGKKLNIIGVENWGHSNYFPKKGDLKKATLGVEKDDFNVLLSHDPSHFDHELEDYDNVINFQKKIHLTLSGHTHGMQFGIEIPGIIKWSPVKYRYHNWAGLYEKNDRKLYVNRGFGYLAFPGRVGEWPEITVLELKRKV